MGVPGRIPGPGASPRCQVLAPRPRVPVCWRGGQAARVPAHSEGALPTALPLNAGAQGWDRGSPRVALGTQLSFQEPQGVLRVLGSSWRPPCPCAPALPVPCGLFCPLMWGCELSPAALGWLHFAVRAGLLPRPAGHSRAGTSYLLWGWFGELGAPGSPPPWSRGWQGGMSRMRPEHSVPRFLVRCGWPFPGGRLWWCQPGQVGGPGRGARRAGHWEGAGLWPPGAGPSPHPGMGGPAGPGPAVLGLRLGCGAAGCGGGQGSWRQADLGRSPCRREPPSA